MHTGPCHDARQQGKWWRGDETRWPRPRYASLGVILAHFGCCGRPRRLDTPCCPTSGPFSLLHKNHTHTRRACADAPAVWHTESVCPYLKSLVPVFSLMDSPDISCSVLQCVAVSLIDSPDISSFNSPE